MTYLIWAGSAVTVISVVMLGWCVHLALQVRRAQLDDAGTRAALRKVFYWNMGALGVAAIGLMAVLIGVILS